ncbi:uncharacterized protein N7459_005605 [Penicillium hispanicum]|uniref:uncharacterized protein n=1 Tax=Penicillium hispanicum TaxID=1080232 RepID=UPI00254250D9|nr:uncharacterized protein N7459_005605 [Penicillium hispanicum]KAJ5579620.1 hypothetical protein N7459_005605 [Penicillium hispanicum]
MSAHPKIVFGGGAFMDTDHYATLDTVKEVLDILEKEGVESIDTATIYGNSEDSLGNVGAAERFSIDTKLPGGFSPEPTTKESVIATAEKSLQDLKTDQVDVYYLHAPDRRSPLEDILSSINALHQSGKFKRFGLSNFLAAEVEEVVRVSREKGYVVPTVYQGNYSAVARRAESEILPTLRKHGIAFYAYSPIAGGFLTKDIEQIMAGGDGRWDPATPLGQLYHALYNKSSMREGLKLWGETAQEVGIPKGELAYRWVTYNSALKGELGDAVIVGSRIADQLTETLGWLKKGPLSAEIAARVEEVWKIVESDAPLDNFNPTTESAK